ncbi:MAG: sigma-70 family RNA polymerase sigma factor [Verrucomicrobiales bacterium]|nr:sigma-70 family RNA polymerase sigma factor [Verrucomicrobiales bacterium]
MMSDLDPSEQTEAYLNLLNKHERKLSVYVHTLVRDLADAEDIMQACRLTMWKRFSSFEAGSSFPAWGKKIALNQILNYRRSVKRKPLHTADPEFIESVAKEIDRQSDELLERSEALKECLRKLPDQQRQTIVLRYYDGCEIEEIARTTGRTGGAVYRLLSRIRRSLNECITSRLRLSA